MKVSTRIIISVLLLALIGGGTFWLARRPLGSNEETDSLDPASGPQVVLSGSELRHSEGGLLAWKVIMDEVELQAGGGQADVKGLREGLVYDKQGTPQLKIAAQKVTVDTAQQNFEMTGQVTVTSPKGVIITTDRVQWFNNERRLHCPGGVVMKTKRIAIATSLLNYMVDQEIVNCPNQVRMYSGNNRLSGNSLTYNVATEIVDLVGGIQMTINPQEARELLKELRKR